MLLLDVNVVLAAHREDHPHYAPVRGWFEDMLAGDERFAVPAFVWTSFLRLATHRRVFEVPTPRAEAFAFIAAACEHPLYLPIGPGPRHLALLRQLSDEADATGDLIVNAAIAAIAVEHGGEVVSLDRDFGRFPSVRHRRPAPA